jgi:hypothetical protein
MGSAESQLFGGARISAIVPIITILVSIPAAFACQNSLSAVLWSRAAPSEITNSVRQSFDASAWRRAERAAATGGPMTVKLPRFLWKLCTASRRSVLLPDKDLATLA